MYGSQTVRQSRHQTGRRQISDVSGRQITLRLALAAGGIALAFLAAELALRLADGAAAGDAAATDGKQGGIMHRQGLDGTGLGWVPIPGIRRRRTGPDGEPFTLRINADGQRGPELEQRRAGHRRILFLGDSFTMAGQLPEEDTFVYRTGALLREAAAQVDVEVVNGGVNGYSNYQELAYYQRHRRRLRPDTVVLCFFLGNDFRDNMVHTSEARRLRRQVLPRGFRYFDRHVDRYLYGTDGARLTDPLSGDLVARPSRPWLESTPRHSYLARLIVARGALALGQWTADLDRLDPQHRYYFYEIGLYQRRQDGLYATAVDMVFDCIEELQAAVSADGGELMVALIPSQSQVDPEYWRYTLRQLGLTQSELGDIDLRYPNRLLVDFLEPRSIPVVDLTDAFLAAPDPSTLFLPHEGDRHFSAAGHRVAAREIAALVSGVSARLRDPAVDMRREAEARMREGDAEAAEGLLRQAVETSGDWQALYHDLAALYHRQGRVEESVGMYERANALVSLDTGRARTLARLYLVLGDTTAAITWFGRVLELDPHHPARADLTHLYVERRQHDEAKALGAEQARLQARAVALRRRRVERTGADPMAHFALGNSLEAAGDLPAAIQAYERALALQPDFVEAGINLGALYVGVGRLEAAAAALERALAGDPERVEALNNLGLIYRERGRLEEARDLYVRALQLQPNLAQAHFNLGLVYRGLGQREQAIEHLKEAIRLDPGIKELYAVP